jgi:FkbM family methyltransferase
MDLSRLLRSIINHPLNDGARLAAVSRFIRWQLASRIIKRPISLPFVEDTVLLTQSGMTGATYNWYCGLHEPQEMGFVLHATRPDDLFVDVGANVGSYTILAAGVVKARVISVEPIPSTFEHLQANIRLNKLNTVEAHCCGLSSSPGELRFITTLDTMNRVALHSESLPTTVVPVTTLDLLLAGQIPKIIKIDVEGHELAVLNGGFNTLSAEALEAVILETNGSSARFGVTDDALFQKMRSFGFESCEYDPFDRRLRPGRSVSGNTVFVRDVERMNNCCIQAPRYKLINGTI